MPSNCMFRGKWHSGEMVFGGNDTQSSDHMHVIVLRTREGTRGGTRVKG